MNCHCCSGNCRKSGSYKNKNRLVQRYACDRCGKSFSESQPLEGVRVDFKQACQVVSLLCEGMGIRAVERFTGLARETVLNILVSAGEQCARVLDTKIRNVKVPVVAADEVFSYVQQKPNGKNEDDPERGECWTYLGVAKHEKLIINYRVSKRTGEDTVEFLEDLKRRMDGRFQFTTDGFRGYCAFHSSSGNVEDVLGDVCDYAVEIKRYKKDPNYNAGPRYYAPYLAKVKRTARFGYPDMSLATTCHVERTNLTLRTFSRRFVRCTINFSKKVDNHRHAVALFIAHFNFCRIHQSLEGKTPAMTAGLTDHQWTVKELLSV